MREWVEYAVTFVTGSGERRTVMIDKPEDVIQYCRVFPGGQPDWSALRIRKVRAAEWHCPSPAELADLRKADES